MCNILREANMLLAFKEYIYYMPRKGLEDDVRKCR